MTAATSQPPTDRTSGLGALVERHQQALWRYLRLLGASPDLADDLLQQTFVVALPARSQRLLRGTYAEERGRDAMAAELGMRPDGIKTALRRLRAALRRCIEQHRREN